MLSSSALSVSIPQSLHLYLSNFLLFVWGDAAYTYDHWLLYQQIPTLALSNLEVPLTGSMVTGFAIGTHSLYSYIYPRYKRCRNHYPQLWTFCYILRIFCNDVWKDINIVAVEWFSHIAQARFPKPQRGWAAHETPFCNSISFSVSPKVIPGSTDFFYRMQEHPLCYWL